MVERLATEYTATGQLVDLFYEHLKLCKVHEGERVLIHSDPGTYPHYPGAAMAAAIMLGADVFQVVHPADRPEKSVIKLWEQADIVLDMSSVPHAYGQINRAALDAGTRIQRIAVPEKTMRRLFPTQELKERVLAGQEIMNRSSINRMTSPAGTDLTFSKVGRSSKGIYSVSDVPGRWDIWPAGMVHLAPVEDEGGGTLVLAPGDFILVLNQYVIEPIYMEIKDGCITSIKGGMQAELLKRWFAQFDSPDAYRIAHIGWGCEKRANWLIPGQDNECMYCNNQIAFGSNVGIFQGARTLTKSHIDFCSLNNTYWCDDIKIMENGEFCIDELKYKGETAAA